MSTGIFNRHTDQPMLSDKVVMQSCCGTVYKCLRKVFDDWTTVIHPKSQAMICESEIIVSGIMISFSALRMPSIAAIAGLM